MPILFIFLFIISCGFSRLGKAVCSVFPKIFRFSNKCPELSFTAIYSPFAVSTMASALFWARDAISALFFCICSLSAAISCAAVCTACTCLFRQINSLAHLTNTVLHFFCIFSILFYSVMSKLF